MAGPWDQYAEQPPQKEESGPWSQFAEKPDPDMSAMKDYMKGNLEKARAENTAPAEINGIPKPPPHPAEGILDAIEAGWQMSTTGLISRGKLPDTVMPEHAPMFARIASQAATLAGDLPTMLAGAIGGGAAGASAGTVTLPVVGTIAGGTVGAAAGAFALPGGVRKILMDHYQKGDIQNFSDFWERSSGALWEMTKGGVTGAATAITGGAAAPLGTLAATTAEIATMTTVGKAMEGQVPEAQDFLDAALLVGGLHAIAPTAGKIRSIYAETGMKPADVVRAAQEDPTVKQDLLSSNVGVPEALKSPTQSADLGNEEAPTPLQQIGEPSSVLNEPGKTEGVSAEPLPEAPKEENVSQRTSAESEVLKKIVPSAEKKTEFSWDKTYSKVIDDLHPLKNFEQALTGEKLPTSKSPYDLGRLTRGSFGKADQFIEHAPFDFNTLENTGTKSLKDIIEPHKEDLDGLRAYIVSKHAIETEAGGKATGIPLESAQEVVKNGKGKYDQASKEISEYNDKLLKYVTDSGLVSKDSAETFRQAYNSYVPFYRLMDEPSGGTGGRGLNVQNPIKGRTGSERAIIDPIESMIKNTYAFVTLAERNRVLSSMADLADKSENGKELMEKVPSPMKAIEVSEGEVGKFFEEHGIDADPEAMTIFRPQSKTLAKDEIAVFRDGKREVYKVNPEVADAVKSLDRESSNVIVKILAKPASFLRAGSTLAPDFALRNVIKDQITAFSFSRNGYLPVIDMVKGMGSLLKEDEHFQDWLKGGGGNSAMVSIDRDYIQQNIFKLSKETGLMDNVQNIIKSPIEMLRVVSEVLENATRLGEFRKATEGKSGIDAIQSGALESREVTLDFSRMGGSGSVRAMNQISAFWNAHVQGPDRAIRAFQENPMGFMAKVGASITLPSVLLWANNHNDPRWDEVPRWQKDLFWIVMTKDHIFRIPKPGELGIIFGSLPERVLEGYFKDSPHAIDGFMKTVGGALLPEYMPTFASPFIDHFANKSQFTGRAIVPADKEGLLPELRYNEYTSESAKILGKMVAAIPGLKTASIASPAILENYIKAWSGNMGGYALTLADQGLYKSGIVPDPIKPLATLADIPAIKAFVIRYPSAGSQSIQDFYDKVSDNGMIQNSIKYLAKSGDVNGAMEMSNGNLEAAIKLDGIKKALAAQSGMVQKITQNPSMTPVDKRQLIDGIYYQMAESARMGNKLMDEWEKASKAQSKAR